VICKISLTGDFSCAPASLTTPTKNIAANKLQQLNEKTLAGAILI
jgi:hypothetical protein